MAWQKPPTFRIKIVDAGKVSYYRGDPFNGERGGTVPWEDRAGEFNSRESAERVASEWVVAHPDSVATVEGV